MPRAMQFALRKQIAKQQTELPEIQPVNIVLKLFSYNLIFSKVNKINSLKRDVYVL
jgi:hypothetical protein